MSISKLGTMNNLFATTSIDTSVKPQDLKKNSNSVWTNLPNEKAIKVADISINNAGPGAPPLHHSVSAGDFTWAYAATGDGPGVTYMDTPGRAVKHIRLTREQDRRAIQAIEQVRTRWDDTPYNLFNHNCRGFAEEAFNAARSAVGK